MGANVLVEFENVFFNWGHFFKLGAMGANLLVEFENIFFNLGHFFYNWGQKFILGWRKSAILGIIWTPASGLNLIYTNTLLAIPGFQHCNYYHSLLRTHSA